MRWRLQRLRQHRWRRLLQPCCRRRLQPQRKVRRRRSLGLTVMAVLVWRMLHLEGRVVRWVLLRVGTDLLRRGGKVLRGRMLLVGLCRRRLQLVVPAVLLLQRRIRWASLLVELLRVHGRRGWLVPKRRLAKGRRLR